MEAKDYLSYIAREIHTTIVATVDDAGLPVTAAIDIMDSGEWFDLSKKPIERANFSFGGTEQKQEGYLITDRCIGCGTCLGVCPQNCIDGGSVPFVIEQEHCLHCGNCFRDCPVSAIEKLGG